MENGIITSTFGSRTSPITGKTEFHTGIDIGVTEGSPVFATAKGIVTQTGYSDSYGYYLRLECDDGNSLFYAHLKGFAVNEGDNVTKGQTIAYSGNTGWSTGAHLHYEISRNGTLTDPMKSVNMAYTQEAETELSQRSDAD